MREKPKLDLGLTAFDELFKDDKELREGRLPKIYDIPIELIDDFPDHPFKVRMDEDMDQLVESIKERGLITPMPDVLRFRKVVRELTDLLHKATRSVLLIDHELS